MALKQLVTSFDTWLPHQKSNASDDLISEIIDRNLLPKNYHLLRKIPVDFQLAPAQVIARINELKPDIVICCGMAESRELLTVELNGKFQDEVLTTTFKLQRLIKNLNMTSVSDDAGQFVCNHLYYSVLKHIQENQINSQCLFVHVPILNEQNRDAIVTDFLQLTENIALV